MKADLSSRKTQWRIQDSQGFDLKKVVIVALLIITVACSVGQASAATQFTQSTKRAVFLSPLERWMSTWDLNGYVSQLERAGYQVDTLLDGNVSIAFLRTKLVDYDLIILRTDAFVEETFGPFYCSGETINATMAKTFADEISSREIKIGACLGFSPAFLQHSYPMDSLRDSLVYVIASNSNYLSSAFLTAGASAFIGYDLDFTLSWGRIDALSTKLLMYLAEGFSVKNAIIQLFIYLHTGHGRDADWLTPTWSGDGDFKI